MAHITYEARKQLAADANGLLKRVPSDMRRELGEHLRVLTDFPNLDPGETRDGRKTEKARDQIDQSAAFVWSLLDEFESWEAEQPTDHGEVVARTTGQASAFKGDVSPAGEWIERVQYQDGTVEEHLLDSSAMDERKALETGWLDAKSAADDDRWKARQFRQSAATAPDPSVAQELRNKADEFDRKAREATERVTNEIVADAKQRGLDEGEVGSIVRSFELPYNPRRPGVAEVLGLVKAGKVTEAYDHLAGLYEDREDLEDGAKKSLRIAAGLQIMETLDSTPEGRDIAEQFGRIEGERRVARARFLREAGMA